MQAQPISSPTREAEAATDALVLDLLLRDGPALWTVDELAREVGHALDTKDAMARLEAAGLLHRCGEFVLASRAGVRARELSDPVS